MVAKESLQGVKSSVLCSITRSPNNSNDRLCCMHARTHMDRVSTEWNVSNEN